MSATTSAEKVFVLLSRFGMEASAAQANTGLSVFPFSQ